MYLNQSNIDKINKKTEAKKKEKKKTIKDLFFMKSEKKKRGLKVNILKHKKT
tara:strand:+ start:286 stop:441 length:156 start_codon:yes stop_codon:yes gene_type:complete